MDNDDMQGWHHQQQLEHQEWLEEQEKARIWNSQINHLNRIMEEMFKPNDRKK